MKGELLYTYSRFRWRVAWAIAYIALLAAALFGFYQFGNSISTHTVPVGSLQLSVPYSKYLVGEDITFTITNRYNSTAYVTNNCPGEPLSVYQSVDGKWQRIHDKTAASACVGQKRQIAVPPGGHTSGSYAAWRNLFIKPGKYRIVASVEYYNALPYQDIEVIAKPTIPTVPKQSPSTTTPAPTTPSQTPSAPSTSTPTPTTPTQPTEQDNDSAEALDD